MASDYSKTFYGYTYTLSLDNSQDQVTFTIVKPDGNPIQAIIDNNFCRVNNTNIVEVYQTITSQLDKYSYAVYYNECKNLIFETSIHRDKHFFDIQIQLF